MASKLLGSFGFLSRAMQSLQITNKYTKFLDLKPLNRNTSFFNKLPADDLWKGVTSVSNAGRKRGRGKGLMRRKDLNRGQVIGVGKANIQWPGLSAPIIRGRELVQQQQLPEDPERENKLRKLRDGMSGFRSNKINSLERGWSGHKMPGRSIGAPDPIGEDAFDGFDSKVLELKTVFNMKGNMGRKRRLSTLVVTGNMQGLAGFALGKAVDTKAAIRKAKNRAGQKLMYVELCDGHTVFHDFFCQFGKTKIFVQKKPEEYGLICHRAIKTICEVIGIRNLYAKIEGPTCLQHIVKAFFLGLLQQKSHDQIAESKGLHLVEFRKEYGSFPKVIASPTKCREANEIKRDEIMDYTQYAMGGKLVLKKKPLPKFYTKHRSYEIFLKKQEKIRNHFNVRLQMLSEHGELKSFLTDKYPECKPFKKTKEEAE